MIKLEDLERQIRTEEIGSLYLFYGEETYLQEVVIKKIIKRFGECINGINYILLDESNVENIISEIEVPAFGYEKKLIIAKNTGIFKKESKKKTVKSPEMSSKIKEYIETNLNMILQSCIIIFSEQEAEKNSLFELIDKNGIVCNFEKLKPMVLVKRLKAICDAYKVNVDSQTLSYLVENVGTDMQIAINEIRKLIEYAGENRNYKKRRYR